MPTRSTRSLVTTCAALAAGALTVACVEDPDLGSTAAEVGSCKPWGCGDNSPVIDNHGFHELNQKGQVNTEGLYIHAFTKAGQAYQIDLVGTELVARDGLGAIALSHAALEGAIIHLRSDRDPAVTYQLSIDEVNPGGASYWQGPATPLETYRIRYGVNGAATRRELCDNPSLQSFGLQGTPMNVYDVVLFGSERYDARTKTISATGGAAAGWINVGCAGGALAKLLLDRHVPVAHAPGYVTTQPARQAMLKMFAADYCGTGQSFTHTGEPLTWRDAAGWVPAFPAAVTNHEAWWDEHGALCLEVPRLDVTTTPYPGNLQADLARACAPLPPCSSMRFWPAQLGGARFISANPAGS